MSDENENKLTPNLHEEPVNNSQEELLAELQLKTDQAKYYAEKLEEIYRSDAWRLVQMVWRSQVAVRSLLNINSLVIKISRFLRTSSSNIQRRINRLRIRLTPVQRSQAADEPDTVPVLHKHIIGNRHQVLMITERFLDFNGNNAYRGGAERYLVELSKLIAELGYEPLIVQAGNSDWERFFGDLRIIGLDVGGNPHKFHQTIAQCDFNAALLIYSPFSVAKDSGVSPSIGISHGVYWDHAGYHTFPNNLAGTVRTLLKSFQALDRIVSVDTNTINWVRTVQHTVSERCEYIPNFVDTDVFLPAAPRNDDRLVILYPRRLYRPRGFYLAAEVIDEILERYPQVDFLFVGQADAQEEIEINRLTSKHRGRVKWFSLPMEQMHEAYQQADISIIPTISSEGTSLSCLEALACGNTVVATNVGGLTDLILSGHNGVLIEPTRKSLLKALVDLIENPEYRCRLAVNGRESAKAFSIERWQDSWRGILKEYLKPIRHESADRTAIPLTAVIPNPNWSNWSGLKQRPHHIAVEFARNGYETYWLNSGQRQADPRERLHILGNQDDLYLKRPFLFLYYPFAYEEISKYDDPVVIYDVLDDISIHELPEDPSYGQRARDYHNRLMRTADYVVTSSEILLDQVRKQRPDAIYLPNGVYLDHFNPDQVVPARSLAHIKGPIVGYHGAIATWFDGQLLAATAAMRPTIQFVIVGPISDDQVHDLLRKQPNIHLIDTVPYEELPSYVARFDVGTIPFVISKLTHAVRPLKALEYMAMRKPVIATPMNELRGWPGVTLAATPGEFARAIDQALAAGPIQEQPADVQQLLASSTWQAATQKLFEELQKGHE